MWELRSRGCSVKTRKTKKCKKKKNKAGGEVMELLPGEAAPNQGKQRKTKKENEDDGK